MHTFDPAAWDGWGWGLHALGVFYVVGFVVYWFHLHGLERRAFAGGPADVRRFNREVERFPGSVYAKMCGKRALEENGDGSGDGGPAAGE